MPASTKSPAIAPTTVTAVDAPVWDRNPSPLLSSPLLSSPLLSSPPGSEFPPSSSPEGVVPVAVPDGAGLLDGLALGEGE